MAERPSLLIVDDEARILSALRRSLRREGYEIVTAETAEEALRLLGERPVDAILSDQKLPGMEGSQFLAEAARLCPEAVRMIITGWTEEIPRERFTDLIATYETGEGAGGTGPVESAVDEELKERLRSLGYID